MCGSYAQIFRVTAQCDWPSYSASDGFVSSVHFITFDGYSDLGVSEKMRPVNKI